MRAYELMIIADGDLEESDVVTPGRTDDQDGRGRRRLDRLHRQVGQAPLRLRDQQEDRGLLRRLRDPRRGRRPRRPRALPAPRGRGRPPQAHPPARPRGRPAAASSARQPRRLPRVGRGRAERRQPMADNTVTVIGNVTRDPELRFTPSGQAVATFGLAVNRRWQNRPDQEWEEQTSFFDVKCWAQLAENVSESLAARRPRHRHRSPRAALVGDRAGREALQGRDRRRRGRPQPALGHRRGHARTSAATAALRRQGGGGKSPADPRPTSRRLGLEHR